MGDNVRQTRIPNSSISRARATPRRNAEQTRERILTAGIVEFCDKGYEGARIDRISKRARCNIRMIYHYFDSKENLYLAALERVYETIRSEERELNLREHDPADGIAALVDFTFHYLRTRPEFVALISNENILQGRHLRRSKRVPETTLPLVDTIRDLLRRGVDTGQFRSDLDPVQLYVTIVALCYFHIGNRYTLSIMFQQDFGADSWLDERCRHARDVVLRYVSVDRT